MPQAFQPSQRLRDRIESIQFLESAGGELTVLPSSSAVLGLQLSGRVRLGGTALNVIGISGLQGAARRYEYEPGTLSLLVRFTPQGLASLGVPAAELTDRSIGLGELLPPARVREAWERLLAAGGTAERVALIEALIGSLPYEADAVVERAVALLSRGADEDASVATVARAVGLSERQLERRFLARVGLTPKRFASLRRFERALDLARGLPSLTDVALAAGYYDQSHFVREVRRFAGTSPGALFPRR